MTDGDSLGVFLDRDSVSGRVGVSGIVRVGELVRWLVSDSVAVRCCVLDAEFDVERVMDAVGRALGVLVRES